MDQVQMTKISLYNKDIRDAIRQWMFTHGCTISDEEAKRIIFRVETSPDGERQFINAELWLK